MRVQDLLVSVVVVMLLTVALKERVARADDGPVDALMKVNTRVYLGVDIPGAGEAVGDVCTLRLYNPLLAPFSDTAQRVTSIWSGTINSYIALNELAVRSPNGWNNNTTETGVAFELGKEGLRHIYERIRSEFGLRRNAAAKSHLYISLDACTEALRVERGYVFGLGELLYE